MSYSNVVEGLHERFAMVSGLSAETILDYEPTAVHATPLLYSLLVSYARDEIGGHVEETYRIMHRLCFNWQDNEQAEQELIPYVDAIPLSVEQDPKLGGRIPDRQGCASIDEARAGFASIDGTVYRVVDFFSETSIERKNQNDLGPC